LRVTRPPTTERYSWYPYGEDRNLAQNLVRQGMPVSGVLNISNRTLHYWY
jgi:hypothetical protein